MKTFTQHVPAMVDIGNEYPFQFNFNDLEELLSHEYVKRFFIEGHIWKYSPAKYAGDRECLMITNDDNSWWWVVGYITDGAALGLPIWK
jgi:hypothetical protein